MAKYTRKKSIVKPAQTRRGYHKQGAIPGNDFYTYVNEKWLQKVNIPAYESSFGVSEEIEEDIRKRLLGIVRSLVAGPEPTDKHAAATRTFFKAGMFAVHHENHMKTFRRMMTEFGCMKTPADYARNLGTLVARGVPTLLSVNLGRSLEDPDENVLQISPGYLGLPDASYYKGEAPGKMGTLRGFEIMMRRLGQHLEYEGLERIVVIESHVADIYDSAESEDPEMMSGGDLERNFKHVPWSDFWAGYGLKEWKHLNFLVQGRSWFNWLDRQFRIMPAADWILWFRSQVLLYFGPFLEPRIKSLYFNFFGRRLRGNKERMTQEFLLYFIAQSLLMVSLSKLYKNCCLSDEHQRAVRGFAASIQHSAIKRIDDATWLSLKARERTKKKIAAMDLSIAEVDDGAHYKLPELSEVDLIYNICELSKAAVARNVHYVLYPKLELPVMDPVFEVNAHYYNSGNRLVIPGGITLWPFYSPEARHLGWSYGGLGAVVGHEMLHGFDEEGKDYDERGVYGPWWSSADLAAYGKKAKALIRLFSATEYLGHPLNGKATLSENIADLGGLAIALDALKRRTFKGDAERKVAIKNFFISYATSWRAKERKTRSLYRLFTDVHAPASVRVNRIVAHFQDWYDAFDVTPENALYIDPKDRISIF